METADREAGAGQGRPGAIARARWTPALGGREAASLAARPASAV